MSTSFDQYPRWARTLAHGIRARLGNTFVLHGSTHDLVPVPKPADAQRAPGDFVPAGQIRRRLDLRPAGRGHRVPARQRPDVPHARVASALHRRGLRRRRRARHRSRPIAAARTDGLPLAAGFLPEADDPSPAAARRRGDLSLRRNADPGIERRVERRRPGGPRVSPEMGDRPGAAGRERHRRADHGEPRRHQLAHRPVAADRGNRGGAARRGRAPAVSARDPRRRLVRRRNRICRRSGSHSSPPA